VTSGQWLVVGKTIGKRETCQGTPSGVPRAICCPAPLGAESVTQRLKAHRMLSRYGMADALTRIQELDSLATDH
jgi:hypothetical protein